MAYDYDCNYDIITRANEGAGTSPFHFFFMMHSLNLAYRSRQLLDLLCNSAGLVDDGWPSTGTDCGGLV